MKHLLLILIVTLPITSYADLDQSLPDMSKFPSVQGITNAPNEDCNTNDNHEFDVVSFENISSNISSKLKTKRAVTPFMQTCFKQMGLTAPDSFQDAIRFSVKSHFEERSNQYSVLSLFGTKDFKQKVSLISSPMCTDFDAYFVAGSSDTGQKVANKFKDKQVNFAKAYNQLHYSYIEAIEKKLPDKQIAKRRERIEKFYYSFLASLAQHESLSTANTSSSSDNAKKISKFYEVEDYTKAKGVKFYYDKYQSNEHSAYNIGLFQFSADRRGNISPCVESWNKTYAKKYPKCKIHTSSNKQAFQLLAASDQIFNAFCGASKLIQSKAIQINSPVYEAGSKKRRRTPEVNTVYNEKTKKRTLKEPKNRCFSPFAFTSHTYNHFGTLMHTVFVDKNGRSVSRSVAEKDISKVKSTNTIQVIDHALEAIAPPKD